MNKRKYKNHILFDKSNLMVLFAGMALMLLGYVLMIGGGYSDPMTPNYDVKYGFRTTILSPFLILLGLCVVGYSILKPPSQAKKDLIVENLFNKSESIVSKTLAKDESQDAKIADKRSRKKGKN